MEKCKIVSIKKTGKKQTYNISMMSNQRNYAVFGNKNDSYIISKNSSAYGYITYQTAYLKAYYPSEFISSLLTTSASVSDEKLEIVMGKLTKEFPKMVIESPRVNDSHLTYFPIGDPDGEIKIIAPIFSLKGVGRKVSDNIVLERGKIYGGKYSDVSSFFKYMNVSGKTNISNVVGNILIDEGVLDDLDRENYTDISEKRERLKSEMIRSFTVKKLSGKKSSYNFGGISTSSLS